MNTKIAHKLQECMIFLEEIKGTRDKKLFFTKANAFLTACRSVMMIVEHMFGYETLRNDQKKALDHNEVTKRKAFDVWYKIEAKAIHDHPFKDERDEVIHRSGQCGFMAAPDPIYGLGTESSVFDRSFAFRRGRLSLPMTNHYIFLWVQDGNRIPAYDACRDYLTLIQAFVTNNEHRLQECG